MANIKSAKKRAIQNEKRRQHNASLRSRFRTHIKKVLKAVAANDVPEAKIALTTAIPVIDSMASKGIIHKNKAARHKSRLHAKVKAIHQAQTVA